LEWWGLSLPVDSKGLKIAVAEAEEMLVAFTMSDGGEIGVPAKVPAKTI
jgi:hypothetical protein